MICNLYDRIVLSVRKVPFAACTLNVERQDPEGGQLAPLTIRSMADNVVPQHVDLNLAVRSGCLAEKVLARWSCYPISANHVSIYHETHDEENVALISQVSSMPEATKTNSTFQNSFASRYIAEQC